METIHVTPAGCGEHLQVLTDLVTIKASGKETSGKILLLEILVPPGGGPPSLHRHAYAETFYILEGIFEMSAVDGEHHVTMATIKAGDTVAIPSLTWHNFRNIGSTAGRFLAVHSPAGMEAFARELGVPVKYPFLPERPSAPPSEEERKALMDIIAKYMEIRQQ